MQQLLGKPFEQGYNAMDDRIENLIEAGVIDPAKVRAVVPGSTSNLDAPANHWVEGFVSVPARSAPGQ